MVDAVLNSADLVAAGGALNPSTATPLSSPGSGASSERFGVSSTATGAQATAVGAFAVANFANGLSVGYDSQVTGTFACALGRSSRAGPASVVIGYAAVSTATGAVGVGNSAGPAGAGSVALGQTATVAGTETQGVAIGQNASITAGATGGGENIALGGAALASEWRATALGWKSKATAISSTAVGRGAFASATHAIAIGRGAWMNVANSIAIGFSGGDVATDVFFESGHTHKYVDWPDGTTITRNPSLTPIVIHGFDAYDATGAPTNNVAGGNLVLAAGRNTGTAAGGDVLLQTSPAGGVSNNTKATLATILRVTTRGTVNIPAIPTSSAGLVSGDLWSNAGVLTIVP